MATHSNILAWRISWTVEPGRLQSMGVAKELDTTEHTLTLCKISIGRLVSGSETEDRSQDRG